MKTALKFRPGDRLLVMEEVQRLVPFTSTHIYALLRRGKFPTQVRLGDRRVAWLEREILAWLEERAANKEEKE